MATVTNTRTDSTGMGPKKTLIVMVTVVGCIAILWPKVFYPMMAGNQQPKNNAIKDHRTGGCCDVVLDQDELLANESANFLSHHAFRKTVHQLTEEQSIRQERPPLLRTEPMHPAMRERGRTIPPNTQSVPILERGHPPVPPKVVEGRPIPGMRPPMGAGSYQAPKQSATSMSFIMPLYTIGIVSFFIYTIMKLVMKKPQRAPYENVTPDPAFRNEVFTPEVVPQIKRPDDGTTKLGSENNAQGDIHQNGMGGLPAVETNGFTGEVAVKEIIAECKQELPSVEPIEEPIDFIVPVDPIESVAIEKEQLQATIKSEPEIATDYTETEEPKVEPKDILVEPVAELVDSVVKISELESSVVYGTDQPVTEPIVSAVKISTFESFMVKSSAKPEFESEPVTEETNGKDEMISEDLSVESQPKTEELLIESSVTESIEMSPENPITESKADEIINEPVIVAEDNVECVATEDISDEVIEEKPDSMDEQPKVRTIPVVVEGEEAQDLEINEVTEEPKPEIAQIIIERMFIIDGMSMPLPVQVPDEVKFLDDEAELDVSPRKRTVSFSNKVATFERNPTDHQIKESENKDLLYQLDQAEKNFEDTNTAEEDIRMAQVFVGGHSRTRRVSFKSDEIEKDPYKAFDEIGVVETLSEDKKYELMNEAKMALVETSELFKDDSIEMITLPVLDEQPIHVMVPTTPSEEKPVSSFLKAEAAKQFVEAESFQMFDYKAEMPVFQSEPEPPKEPEVDPCSFMHERIDKMVEELFSKIESADKEETKENDEEPNSAEVEVYLGNRRRTRSVSFRRSSFVENEYSSFHEVGVAATISTEKEQELKDETSSEIQKVLEAASSSTMQFIGSSTVHIDDNKAEEPELLEPIEPVIEKSKEQIIASFEAAVVEEIKPSLDLHFTENLSEPLALPKSPIQEISPLLLEPKEDKIELEPVQVEEVHKVLQEIEALVAPKPRKETVLVEKITEKLVDVHRETERTAQVVKELVEIVTVILEPEMPPELRILETKHAIKAVEEAKANGAIKEIEISISDESLESLHAKVCDKEHVEIIKQVIDSVSESLSKTHEVVDKVIDEAVSITTRKEPAFVSGFEQSIDNVIFGAAEASLAKIEKVAEEPTTAEKLEQEIRELTSSVAESTEKIRIKLLPNENLNLKWIDGKLVATSETEHFIDLEAKLLACNRRADTTIPKPDPTMSEDDTLLELDLLRRKLDDTERAMSKIIAKMGSLPIKGQESSNESLVTANGHMKSTDESHTNNVEKMVHRKRDTSADRGTIKVMGMEMTASHESSPRKRPVTPTLMLSSKFEPPTIEDDTPKAQEIYLQGSLPHESKILVSDSETAVEDAVQLDDEDYDQDEAPVILSGKMTLSLINMDHMEKEALVGDIEIEKEPFEDAEEYRQDKLGDEQHTVNEE